MAKEHVLAGTQTFLTRFFARRTAVATGAGAPGLTASQISCSYIRLGAASPVAVPLVEATLGTYSGTATAGGIATVRTTAVPNSTGLYEFQPPNNAFASGARTVIFFLSDIGNSDTWEPVQLEFALVADDPSTRLFDVSTLTMTTTSSVGKFIADRLDTNVASRLSPDGTLDVVTQVTSVTGNVAGSVGSVTGNVGGNVVGSVGSVVGAVGSVTAGVTVAAGGLDATGPTVAYYERVADTGLKRDWTAIQGEPAARSMWNALRFLRNAWSTTDIAGRVVVKREDDVTTAWSANLGTDAAATPIVASDPTT